MSNKKVLYKVMGDENTMKEKNDRVLTAPKKYGVWQAEEHIVTWKEKPEPRSSWYPRTESQHVHGVKK